MGSAAAAAPLVGNKTVSVAAKAEKAFIALSEVIGSSMDLIGEPVFGASAVTQRSSLARSGQ